MCNKCWDNLYQANSKEDTHEWGPTRKCAQDYVNTSSSEAVQGQEMPHLYGNLRYSRIMLPCFHDYYVETSGKRDLYSYFVIR